MMRETLCYPALVLLTLIPATAFAQQPDSVHVIRNEFPAPGWGADFGARFDEAVSISPHKGAVARPSTACEPLTNPDRVEDAIAFVWDGECSYVTKVQHASAAGALAVVVISDDYEHPDSLVLMQGECGVADGCTAPAAFISYHSGLAILDPADFTDQLEIVPVRIASSVNAESAAPEIGYALTPPYPNPFASETVVRFELPTAQRARLAVYDVQGREVRVLVDGMRQAGEHVVAFGVASLPSGVYLVRLEAGSVRLARRVTLVR